ncbi:DUF7507 domain-containing protein [Actinomadura logoneensis]
MRKRARPTTFSRPGEKIHYTYRVSNPGRAPLDRVVDRLRGLSAIHCPRRTLAPDESMTLRHDLPRPRQGPEEAGRPEPLRRRRNTAGTARPGRVPAGLGGRLRTRPGDGLTPHRTLHVGLIPNPGSGPRAVSPTMPPDQRGHESLPEGDRRSVA